MYFVKTPCWLKKLYPQLIWNKARNTKTIFLTFDDGPIPIVTPAVLKILKTHNAKATFFCIGDNIIKHPDIFLQLKADGHAIGNHTQNHLKGWATPNKKYIDNFNKCQNLTLTNLFRPPYGRIKRSQILAIQNLNVKNLNLANAESENSKVKNTNPDTLIYQTETLNIPFDQSNIKHQTSKIIMWDVLSGDFDITLTPEKCLKNVLKNAKSGSVVVFHDSEKANARMRYTLPLVLKYYTEKGYIFEKINFNKLAE